MKTVIKMPITITAIPIFFIMQLFSEAMQNSPQLERVESELNKEIGEFYNVEILAQCVIIETHEC